MRKRPLFWTGVCLVIFLACLRWFEAGGTAEGGWKEPALAAGDETACLPESFSDGAGIRLSGQVAGCSLLPEGMRLFLHHITVFSADGSRQSVDSDHKIFFYTDQNGFLPGDYIEVQGVCSALQPAANPGQFDAEAYYSSENVICSLKKTEILKYRTPGRKAFAVMWKRLLAAVRHRLCRAYQDVLGEEQAAALAAITLGEKLMLEQEQKTLYQEGGIAHILAISGLHISLIGMGLYHLLRRCFVPLPAAAICSGAVMLCYIGMVGWSASSARACVMFFLWLGAGLLGRGYDRLTSLAAAAVCVLAARPDWLGEAAFWLSFLSILSLSTLAAALPGWLGIRTGRGAALAGGAALQMGMLPCTLYFFYQIPPWSVLVNLVVIPLTPFVMVSGMAGGFAGIFSRNAGAFLAAPSHYLLELMSVLCRMERQLPWSLIVCGRPGGGRILLYYLVLGAASCATWQIRKRWDGRGNAKETDPEQPGARRGRRRRAQVRNGKLRLLWGAVFLVCWLLMQPEAPRQLEVICLDTGQGDGILARMPDGTVCMIDGGSSSVQGVWQYRIGQTMKYLGIRRIDWWFVSHSDADHTSGLMEYLGAYSRNFAGENVRGIDLERLVLPVTAGEDERMDELRALAAENRIPVYTMEAGDCVLSDEKEDGLLQAKETGKCAWSLRCLSPEPEELVGDDNQDSLVLLLQYGQFRMLFTGDLEKEGERRLIEREKCLDVDVLKVGHHGSAGASSRAFLQKTSPGAAVISCAARNSYGHPAPAVLKRLRESGCRTACTAWSGAVRITSDGTRFFLQSRL